MKKIIGLLTAAVLLMGTAAAATIDGIIVSYDYTNAENAKTVITVTGELPSGKANEDVTVTVYSSGAVPKLVGVTEAVSEAGGAYTAVVLLGQNVMAGDYTVRVGAAELDAVVTQDRYIVTASAQKSLVSAVNGAASAAELGAAISDIYATPEYGLQFDVFDALGANQSACYALLYEWKQKQAFDPQDSASFAAAFKQSSVLAALNAGVAIKLGDQFGLFPNANPMICEDFKTQLTDAARAAALTMVSGKNYRNAAAFAAGLEDAVVLASVSYPAKFGYAHIMDALTRYRTILTARGFALSAYDSGDQAGIASKLIGVYSTMDAFKNAYGDAVKPSGNSGGGGGGGGGNGGSKGNGTITNTITGPATVPTPVPKLPFSDLDTVTWAADAIVKLNNMGVISGVGDGLFQPDNNILREEFAKILSLAFDLKGNGEPFTDTPEGAWYAAYVNALRCAGIASGREDGSFGVGEDITRAEAAAMVYRTVKKQGILLPSGEVPAFEDGAVIGEFAQEAVQALAAAGVINGKGDGRFHPDDAITRAEAAKIIYNVLAFASEEGNQ